MLYDMSGVIQAIVYRASLGVRFKLPFAPRALVEKVIAHGPRVHCRCCHLVGLGVCYQAIHQSYFSHDNGRDLDTDAIQMICRT